MNETLYRFSPASFPKLISKCKLAGVAGAIGMVLATSATAGEFRSQALQAFVNPAGIVAPAGVVLENPRPGILKVVPIDAVMEISLELKTPVPVPDDSAWFSLAAFIETKTGSQKSLATLCLVNGDGEELQSRSFPFATNRELWGNWLSERTFLKIPAAKRKTLRATRIVLHLDPGCLAVYLKVPTVFSGDTFDPDMLASGTQWQRNVWYGRMAPVFPVMYERRKCVCTLTLEDGFQRRPFYETTRAFDFHVREGLVDPLAADNGFDIPLLPKGMYGCRLIYRDTKTGLLLRTEDFDYEVMSSPLQARPTILSGNELGTRDVLAFDPAQADFVFDGESIEGLVDVQAPGELPGGMTGNVFSVECRLREYTGYWSRYCTIQPETYATTNLVVGGEGGRLPLSLPVPAESRRTGNRAYTLELRLLRDGRPLQELKRTVGVCGTEDRSAVPDGPVLSWKELFAKPILATGFMGTGVPRQDIESFADQVEREGAFDYVLVDALWSPETEPLPGFPCYHYIDTWLAILRKHGLKAVLHGSSTMNQPKWCYFLRDADRVDDGRFLRSHYNAFSIYGDCPGQNIREHILRLGARYGHSPDVAFWEFWGYYGEGFLTDWWLGWQFGGTRGGYSNAAQAGFRNFLKGKYPSIAALNMACDTTFADWNDIRVPKPLDGSVTFRYPDIGFRAPLQPRSQLEEEFQQFRDGIGKDFYEHFIAETFRSLDSDHAIGLFYYASDGSRGFYSRHPGFIRRNGGNEGLGVQGKQYMFFLSYENTPTCSEDVMVYGDSAWDWRRNLMSGARVGGLGVHFFDYDIYQTFPGRVNREHHHDEVTAFFREGRREVFPMLSRTKPFPPEAAVFYDRHLGRYPAIPVAALQTVGCLADPLNDLYLDRLPLYKAVFMTPSAISRSAADQLVKWVRNGGVLVMTPACGVWEELEAEKLSLEINPGDRPPISHPNFLLDRLGWPLPSAGKWMTEYPGRPTAKTLVGSVFDREMPYPCIHEYFDYLFPTNAYPGTERILEYIGGPAGCTGFPAGFVLPVGQGRVVLLEQYAADLEGGLFYEPILEKAGVPCPVRVGNEAGDLDPKTLAYMLIHEDGYRIVMVQADVGKRDASTPTKFRRRIFIRDLPDGKYRVFSCYGEKGELGEYSADALSSEGVMLDLAEGDLRILKVIRE